MERHGWVALLRGINLGSRNRIPMAELRQVFEDAGCSSARTHLQSGNVLFVKQATDRGALARRLERAVDDAFGVPAAVVLRKFTELAEVAGSHPFGRDSSKTVVVFLVEKPPAAKVRSLERLDVAPDRVKVSGSEVFLHYPNGVQGARLSGGALERELGIAGTMRSWKTVARLAELAEA